jgi:hypothetical protein
MAVSSPTIQFKRGTFTNLPGLRAGEPALTTDTFDFYVGIDSTTNNNKFVGSHRYWTKETASKGSQLNLVEGTSNGTSYIALKSPDSLAGVTTYTFPATASDGYFLKTNADGILEWSSVTASATFDNATLSGVATITSVNIQGGSINGTTVGLTTAAAGQFTTLGADSLNVTGIATVGSVSIGATQIVSSEFQLQNIASLDATTIATIEAAVANAPNTFADLEVTGISTFNGNVNIGSDSADIITVNGTTTFAESVTGTISTATRATLVDTTGTSDNISYYLTFVDTAAGENSETLRVGSGVSFNPSTNKLSVVGNVQVGGNNIQSGAGSTAITLSNTDVTVVGDLKVGGNDIQSGAGSTAITLSNTDVTVVGDLKVGGNDIQASDGNTNITLTSNTLTTFAGDIKVGGNDIQASDNTVAITLSGADVTVAGDLKVGGNDIKASDGTTSITLEAVTGNVGISSNLTVQGNLVVNGTTTQIDTSSLSVEDRTIELGRVNGEVPSGATTWDLGVLFNYHATTAKKSGFVWEHTDSRFKFGSEVTADGDGTGVGNPQIALTAFAPIEVSSLWVTDCAGTSQVINCVGTERKLENITVDAGTF